MNQYSPSTDAWTSALFGREIVAVGHPMHEAWWATEPEANTERLVLTLDDGTELELIAELDCCAGGEFDYQNVIGGRVMSVTTEENLSENFDGLEHDDYFYDTDSTYKVFILKDGLPGEITVTSHESNGYYGTGYSLSVRRPEENTK